MAGTLKPNGQPNPRSARLDYDGFLDTLMGIRYLKGIEGAIKQRNDMRKQFWRELQIYLDEYKAHEEKLRYEWDMHMAYFTQIVGPMVEESIYINEMLNQLRSYLKAIADYTANPEENDPWPAGGTAQFSTALGGEQVIDAENPGFPGYKHREYVREKGNKRSYFREMTELGRDRVLGMSVLENVRRQTPEGKYLVIFGSYVRTDKPNGDPDCLGARQSLEFAQLLLDQTGKNRLENVVPLIGPDTADADHNWEYDIYRKNKTAEYPNLREARGGGIPREKAIRDHLQAMQKALSEDVEDEDDLEDVDDDEDEDELFRSYGIK